MESALSKRFFLAPRKRFAVSEALSVADKELPIVDSNQKKAILHFHDL